MLLGEEGFYEVVEESIDRLRAVGVVREDGSIDYLLILSSDSARD